MKYREEKELDRIAILSLQISEVIEKNKDMTIVELIAVLEYHSNRLCPIANRWSVNEARKNDLIKKMQGDNK